MTFQRYALFSSYLNRTRGNRNLSLKIEGWYFLQKRYPSKWYKNCCCMYFLKHLTKTLRPKEISYNWHYMHIRNKSWVAPMHYGTNKTSSLLLKSPRPDLVTQWKEKITCHSNRFCSFITDLASILIGFLKRRYVASPVLTYFHVCAEMVFLI